MVQDRPTYKQQGPGGMFLFYNNGGNWMIGRDTRKGMGQWKVASAALTPNGIVGAWQEWDGRQWISAPSVKARPSFHGW